MSPGWHPNTRQMASSDVKRTALALPVFSIDKLACVSPTRSASSPNDILRFAISTSKFTTIRPIGHYTVKS